MHVIFSDVTSWFPCTVWKLWFTYLTCRVIKPGSHTVCTVCKQYSTYDLINGLFFPSFWTIVNILYAKYTHLFTYLTYKLWTMVNQVYVEFTNLVWIFYVEYINHGPQIIRKIYTPVYIPYVQFVNLDSQTLRRAYLPALQTLRTVWELWFMNYAYTI